MKTIISKSLSFFISIIMISTMVLYLPPLQKVNAAYTNSPLVDHIRISPHKTEKRASLIDTITIHCTVAQCTPEQLGELFAHPNKKASSNYGVGTDGRIGMYCEEKDRSWCSSSAANDHRSITIEVASDSFFPYAVNDRAYNALINLCVDICKRNGIDRLVWSPNKDDRINRLNGANMTLHRDLTSTECPGEFLVNHHGDIAAKVNERLGYNSLIVTPTISLDKSTYDKDEIVNITWTASPEDSNLSRYWVTITAPDGTLVYDDEMEKRNYYSFVASQLGSYSITTYAIPVGFAEDVLSDCKSISVSTQDPIDVGDDFFAYIINVNTLSHLTKDGGNVSVSPETGDDNQIWKFNQLEDASYKITNCADGNVLDVVDFGNNNEINVPVGGEDVSTQSWIIYGSPGNYRFRTACSDSVMEPVKSLQLDGANVGMGIVEENPSQVFQIQKLSSELSVEPGNNTTLTKFTWNGSTLEDRFYDLKLWKGTLGEGDPYHIESGIKGKSLEIDLPAGQYEGYLDTREGSRILMSNVVKFTIEEEEVLLDGDVNLDGKVSVADAVILQKILLGESAEMSFLQSGDLYGGGTINIFDLVMLKRLLINLE